MSQQTAGRRGYATGGALRSQQYGRRTVSSRGRGRSRPPQRQQPERDLFAEAFSSVNIDEIMRERSDRRREEREAPIRDLGSTIQVTVVVEDPDAGKCFRLKIATREHDSVNSLLGATLDAMKKAYRRPQWLCDGLYLHIGNQGDVSFRTFMGVNPASIPTLSSYGIRAGDEIFGYFLERRPGEDYNVFQDALARCSANAAIAAHQNVASLQNTLVRATQVSRTNEAPVSTVDRSRMSNSGPTRTNYASSRGSASNLPATARQGGRSGRLPEPPTPAHMLKSPPLPPPAESGTNSVGVVDSSIQENGQPGDPTLASRINNPDVIDLLLEGMMAVDPADEDVEPLLEDMLAGRPIRRLSTGGEGASEDVLGDDDAEDVLGDDEDSLGPDSVIEESPEQSQPSSNSRRFQRTLPKINDLYELYGEGFNSRVTAATVEQKHNTIVEMWERYCEEQGITKFRQGVGLVLLLPPTLEESINSTVVLNNPKAFSFLKWASQQPGMSKDKFNKARVFLQIHIINERIARENYCLRKGFVFNNNAQDMVLGTHAKWRAMRKDFNRALTERRRNEAIDLHANIDFLIEEKTIVSVIMHLFTSEHKMMNTMSPLYRITTIALLCLGCATGWRGDEARNKTLAMQCVGIARYGPNMNGKAQYSVMDIGKVLTNQCAVHVTGTVPSVNPLTDPVALDGVLLGLRFGQKMNQAQFKGEACPNFENFQELSKTPMYRSERNPKKSLGPDQHYKNTKRAFDSSGSPELIGSRKVTHLPRGHCQNKLANLGIEDAVISRFLNYSDGGSGNKVQANHYYSLPVGSVMVASNGDGTYKPKPQLHNPGWHRLQERRPDCLISVVNFFVPWAYGEQKRLQELHDECPSHTEREANRRYMSLGAINAFINNIERMFLMAAARPFDVTKVPMRLDRDSPPIYILLGRSRRVLFFHHPVFRSAAFLELVTMQKEIQDEEANFESTMSAQDLNSVQRCIVENMLPAFRCLNDRVSTEFSSMNDRISSLAFAMQQQHGQQLHPHPVSGTVQFAPLPEAASLEERTDRFVAMLDRKLPADDVLADGTTQRKKRRAITQTDAALALNALHGPGSETYLFSTTDYVTLEDYWIPYFHGTDHFPAFKQQEAETEDAWRKDAPGSTAKKRTWSLLKRIYSLIEYYMDERGLDEKAALAEADKTFCSVEPYERTTKKRAFAKIHEACRVQLALEKQYPNRPIIAGAPRFVATT